MKSLWAPPMTPQRHLAALLSVALAVGCEAEPQLDKWATPHPEINRQYYGGRQTEIDFFPRKNMGQSLRVFFGDLHVHSNLSDDANNMGCEGPQEILRMARDDAELDFVAFADHDIWLSQTEWQEQQDAVELYNSSGAFIAFSGYEWTDKTYHQTQPPYFWGHINVYFASAGGQVYPSNHSAYDSPVELIGALLQDNVPFVLHRAHPRREAPGYFEYDTWGYAQGLDRWLANAEGYGNCDYQEEWDCTKGMWDGWNSGHRLGVVGGSDSHDDSIGDIQTGVWAANLDSVTILKAIRAKRTYAIDRPARLSVWFSINGNPMGSEMASLGPPEITVEVSDWVSSISVYKVTGAIAGDEAQYLLSRGGSESKSHFFVDDTFTQDCYYYVRVEADGAKVLTSPIWVRKDQ